MSAEWIKLSEWKRESLAHGTNKATREHGPISLVAMSSKHGGAWAIRLNGYAVSTNVRPVDGDIDAAIAACDAAAVEILTALLGMGYTPKGTQ
jgi:hypothetical protein